MSTSRNQRRLEKKRSEKEKSDIVKGMTYFQRMVLNGLRAEKIQHVEIIEMSKYYIVEELKNKLETGDLKKQTTDRAIKLINSL